MFFQPRKIYAGKSEVVNRRAKFRRNKFNPDRDKIFRPFHSINTFSAGVIKKYSDSEFTDKKRLQRELRFAKSQKDLGQNDIDKIKEKISKLKYYIPIFPDLYEDLAFSDYEPDTIEFKMCDKQESE